MGKTKLRYSNAKTQTKAVTKNETATNNKKKIIVPVTVILAFALLVSVYYYFAVYAKNAVAVNTEADIAVIDVANVAMQEHSELMAYLALEEKVTTAEPEPEAESGIEFFSYTGDITVSDEMQESLDALIATYGDTAEAATHAVLAEMSYKSMEETGTIAENAQFLLDTHKGACYQFASLTYILMQELGYEATYIVGQGRNVGNQHAWVSVVEDGETVYYDPCYQVVSMTKEELEEFGYIMEE